MTDQDAIPQLSDSPRAGARRRWLSPFLFATALAIALAGTRTARRNFPPYADLDSATIGIFVNNLSSLRPAAAGFVDSPLFQDQYRAAWAIHFLPVSVPLSWLQRLSRTPGHDVLSLLATTGLVLALIGCACVASCLRTVGRCDLYDVLFVVGFVAVYPPFLLVLRTSVPHFVLPFTLFWLTLALWLRFLSTRRAWPLYAMAPCMAYFALAPYPPLLALPVAAALTAWKRGAVGNVVRTPHLYLAAGLSVGMVLAISYLLGTVYCDSYAEYLAHTRQFVRLRSNAFALSNCRPSLLPGKLAKWTNQHVLFLRDTLGDRSRGDDLWTLGRLHLAWLCCLPLAVTGFWRLARGEAETRPTFPLVLLGIGVVALTVSYPEGRYLLVAVPCYAVFLLHGVRRVTRKRPGRRPQLYAVLLFALACNTYALVTGPYNRYMVSKWQRKAGVREAIESVVRRTHGRTDARVCFPGLDYPELLYARAIADFRVTLVGEDELAAWISPPPPRGGIETMPTPLFVVGRADGRDWPWAHARTEAWERVDVVQDPVTGTKLAVLQAKTPVPSGNRPAGTERSGEGNDE